MAGVTSLPVRVKFWRGTGLSGPAIMVCTNVLVSQSKHSKSCYLLSFSLLLSNSAFFFSVKQSCQQRREAALSGEMEEERDRKMRNGWRERIGINNKKYKDNF